MRKNKNRYEAILFDIGGVLEITGPMNFAARWERHLGLDDNTIMGGLAVEWAAGAIGNITTAELRKALATHVGCSGEVADQILEDMWAQYLGEPNTELIEWLRAHRVSYLTALVSNSFVGAREREEDRYGFSDLVDTIVYSHEVGRAKPDPRIYLAACERLGVESTRCVFLDDAPIAIDGARALRMTPVRHTGNARTISQLDALVPV